MHGRQADASLPGLPVHLRLGIKTLAVILDGEGHTGILLVDPDRYLRSLSVFSDISQGFLEDPVNIDLGQGWKEIIDCFYLQRFPLNIMMYAEILQQVFDSAGQAEFL